MGTSQSSGGPGSGVPMVPPWVPTVADGEAEEAGPPGGLAPRGRFGPARAGLGDYANSGDRGSLRRSMGHYVRTGYGGGGGLVRRMGGTATTANDLYQVLSGGARADGRGAAVDRTLLAGRDAREIIDAVVESTRPVDGTQDAEAAREAIADALVDLLTQYPEADLLALDPEQRAFVIERFVAIDVCRRFELDVGLAILQKAPNASTAMSRLKDIRNFVKEAVALAFRRLRDRGTAMTAATVTSVVNRAMKDAFSVFEEYLA